MRDVRAIRALVARAYDADPMLRWIFPDDDLRPHAAAAWLGLFVEQYAAAGRLSLVGTDDPLAVALWRMPDDAQPPAAGLPSVGGLLAAFAGPHRAAEIGTALQVIGEITPPAPHAYLHFLAVEPGRQGQGLGRQALRPVVQAADAAGVGIHLETTNPANLAFYEAAGFAVSASRDLGTDGPVIRAMWRAAAGFSRETPQAQAR